MYVMNKQTRGFQTGFSLVEIMVALVIGLLATLVITQVLSVYEGQKRTTSGTGDAQTNGALGLDAIQREMLMAGYGLPLLGVGDSPLNCSAGDDVFPVSITDNGDGAGASDVITIRYGDTQSGGVPVERNTRPATMACANGESALVVNGSTCTLTTATRVAANPAAVPPETSDQVSVVAAVAGKPFSCLGQWRSVTFRVTNNQLERVESVGVPLVAGVAAQIGSDIVAMKAQYGISDKLPLADPVVNTITAWVSATGDWADGTITPANRSRIKAIRVAVVARNSLMETTNVAQEACSALDDPASTGLCTWAGTATSPAPSLDLSNTANWQRYRYRVFETIIPLRNMVWAKGVLAL